MYSEIMCAVKIGDKQSDFFTQRRGVRQGCSLSPTLYNVYINELAVELDQCAAPGLSFLDREVKSLLYADELVLLSPTEQGPQQQLDIVEKFCQNWTRLRLSDYKLTIQTGRPKKSWGHCWTGEVETEMHFLLQCETFNETRNIYLNNFSSLISDFNELNDQSKLNILLGEADRTHLQDNKMYCIYT